MNNSKRPVYYEAIIEELDKLSCEDVATIYRICINNNMADVLQLCRNFTAKRKEG